MLSRVFSWLHLTVVANLARARHPSPPEYCSRRNEPYPVPGPASLPRGRATSTGRRSFWGIFILIPLQRRYAEQNLGDELAYDWSGVRTRRIKALKLGISLVIVAAAVAGPAIILLRSGH